MERGEGRSLRGQVALVTGASSGVGWQTAVRLGEEGMKLCVTARRAEALERLREELEGQGVECLVVPADVTVLEDVERVVGRCLEHYGRLDVLVNDAGVQSYGFFERLPWEHIQRIFDVNCFGYMRFARAVLSYFRARGGGHIINVQSMLSEGAAPLLSAYTAAKHATLGWSKCLRLELKGSGVEVSDVLVPSVSSGMFDHAPTMMGMAPQPVPPTYDTDVAARAVVRCALRPGRTVVPVFLQGRLLLWLNQWAPWAGNWLMGRFGGRLQEREEPMERPDGNLFHPVVAGVGRYGSVPPTAPWKRWLTVASMLVLAGGALGGALGGAARGVRGLMGR